MTILVRHQGQTKTAYIPDFLPSKGWSVNTRGYLIFTSRVKGSVIKRGERAHRVVVSKLAGRELLVAEVIHHMDFNKLNNLPHNLLMCPVSFNPTNAIQCPVTGRLMSKEKFVETYGYLPGSCTQSQHYDYGEV